MEDLLDGLRAAGEATRLRILVVVDRCELTVTELCRVLSQTQPRVSRHLKVLTDAGLLERNPQGRSAFFRPARRGPARRLLDAVLPLVDPAAPAHARDLARLATVRAERAAAAAEYFEAVATDWDRMRDLHVADAKVERAMLAAVADLDVKDLLDIGTGTGRVLEVFGDRIARGVGIDRSQPMLDLARSRLDRPGLRHCGVRQGDVYDLRVEPGGFDVAVLHHVLHFLDDPATAIAEVAAALRTHGRLVIVDFAPHGYESMRDEFAHHWLGLDDDDVSRWCSDAGLVDVHIQHLRPRRQSGVDPLTTTIWVATQPSGHRHGSADVSLDLLKEAS